MRQRDEEEKTLKKDSTATFYHSLRDQLYKLVEYVFVLEENSTDLEEEGECLKENLRHLMLQIDHNMYVNYHKRPFRVQEKHND